MYARKRFGQQMVRSCREWQSGHGASESPELDAMLRELEEKYATTPLDIDDDQADARATDMVEAQDDAG